SRRRPLAEGAGADRDAGRMRRAGPSPAAAFGLAARVMAALAGAGGAAAVAARPAPDATAGARALVPRRRLGRPRAAAVAAERMGRMAERAPFRLRSGR